MSSALVSDPAAPTPLRSLSGLLRGSVDADEWDDLNEARIEGDRGRGIIFAEGRIWGIASAIEAARGSLTSCCSCIV